MGSRAVSTAVSLLALAVALAAGAAHATCTYRVDPASASFDPRGGTALVTVTPSDPSCPAVAPTSGASWLTVNGISGANPYTVSYGVAESDVCGGGWPDRTADLTLPGAKLTATQSTLTVTPSSASWGAEGGVARVDWRWGSGCGTAASLVDLGSTQTGGASWLTAPAEESDAGYLRLAYTATPNTSCAGRSFTVYVRSTGRTVLTLFQSPGVADPSIYPTAASPSNAAGSGTFSLDIGDSCPWTASSDAAWLTVTSRTSGSGSTTVNYGYTANGSGSFRVGHITAAGRTFTVTQQGGSSTGCTPDARSLCLLSGRFRVTSTYTDYGGHSGNGTAVALTSDTGYFWFFDAANVEGVIKMVSFCGNGGNNAVAVYATGLTDLGVTFTVTDTATGASKRYDNALGSPFQLIRDAPFVCPTPRVPELATEDPILFWADLDREAAPAAAPIVRHSEPAGTCTPDATSLCLLGGRFRVAAAYKDYGGNTGPGKAVALTPDTGYFWFFSSSNVEVVAKLVDFCSLNGKYAVYANGLTDVEVALTVTDTRTGIAATYTNALGHPFGLIREGAFSCASP